MSESKEESMQKTRIATRKDQLLRFLRRFGYDNWVTKDFTSILQDEVLTNTLRIANRETAGMKFLNRHGVEHGITVSSNAAQLFWLIHNDYVGSDYKEEYAFTKETVLFALITAGYVHDCGRFYDPSIKNHEERVAETMRHLHLSAASRHILGHIPGLDQEVILTKIEELCMSHENKYLPSGKVEIAIIRLADALDCDRNRVYNETDKEILKLSIEDYPDRVKIIVHNDEKPERYFGPEGIEKIELTPLESDGLVEVSTHITSTAAYGEIKSALRVLAECRNSQSQAVKDLANRVRIRIKDQAYDQPFILYPKDPVYLPGACLLLTGYDCDILDMEGTSLIQLPLVIKNESNSGGLLTRDCMLGGLKKVAWDDIEIKKFYEIKKEFKTPNEIEEQHKVPINDPEYLYSGKKGTNHYFKVTFPRKVRKGKVLRLLGTFKWKDFFKVCDDEMNHLVATSTKELFFRFRFPREVKAQTQVDARFEIVTGKPETLVYTEQIVPQIEDNRVYIQKRVANPRCRGMIYRVRWKF